MYLSFLQDSTLDTKFGTIVATEHHDLKDSDFVTRSSTVDSERGVCIKLRH